jgi:2-polyprenyl-6-methoxyphenol hydroxylase-like FAD-dependent oxidoreductase
MADKSTHVDVLVIGAGPSGLTAASELARHGVTCRIVDKKPGPIQYTQALGVQVRTREVLDAMGISHEWTDAGAPFEKMIINAYGEHLATIKVAGVDSFYPYPLGVGQNVTEKLLTENLQRLGVSVERLVEATRFIERDDHCEVQLKHPDGQEETVEADFVVSGEGSNSMVRQALGIQFVGERYEGTEFLQVDGEYHGAYPNMRGVRAFMSKKHGVVLFPLKDENVYRIICFRPDQDPSNRTPPTLEEMQALVREYADPEAEISNPRWLNRFRCQCRAADALRKGRAFLVGDAGHVHVPIGGQGMNTGMQDAFNLAWKLAYYVKGISPISLLDSYNEERHPNALALVKKTDSAFHALLGATNMNELALKLIGSAVLNAEIVQNKVRNVMAEFDVNYRNSAAVEEHGGGSGPKAGDRAPDAFVVQTPQKTTVRLFDVMRHTNWTLFYFAGKDAKAQIDESFAAVKSLIEDDYKSLVSLKLVVCNPQNLPDNLKAVPILIDREHYAHDHYGADHPLLVLVRPDWYIAFRSRSNETENLAKYLQKMFKPSLVGVSVASVR